MTTWAVAMVRDEADIIEATLTRMLEQVDHILVVDHGSVDNTTEILHELDGVEWCRELDQAYNQATIMSNLARSAGHQGADWVVPFDADEVWLSPHGRIGDVLSSIPEDIALATWYDHVTTSQEAGDPVALRPYRKRLPATWPKVAVRPFLGVSLLQGNHDANYTPARVNALEVRHFPYRSAAQMERKVRNGVEASDAAGHPPTVLSHWRELLRLIEKSGANRVWRDQFYHGKPESDTDLVFDPCPL